MKNQIITITTLISIVFLISCETHEMDEPGLLVPKTVDEDPLLPGIEVNGTILHAETFGAIHNPIMVFLHGGPGSDYRDMISEKGAPNAHRYPGERTVEPMGLSKLRNAFYCVFYDQRGAGLSPRFDKGEITFEIYLEDLKEVISYAKNEKELVTGVRDEQVYLFGYSFGGILATGFVNKYPQLVKDIIFYEVGPLSNENWEYFNEHSSMMYAQIGEKWLDEYLLAHEHFTPNDHIRADYQMLLVANRAQPELHEDPDNPFWRFGALCVDENLDFSMSDSYDITSNLSAFKGRAIFIFGSLTTEEYPEYTQLQTAFYSKTEKYFIEGVGHSGVWQKPDEIIQIIRENCNN